MIGVAVATGCLCAVSAVGAARQWVVHRRVAMLHAPLRGAPPRQEGLRWATPDSPTAEIAAATLLDVAVALVRVDPRVLDAIDLAHGDKAFESFGALQHHIRAVMARGDVAFDGLVSQYKGSLGEILAAEELTTAGHAVEFAEHPNQEGWDLLVDGQPVQVKSGLDEGPIEAAAENGDIPVVTVEEHADLAADGVVEVLPISGEALADSTAESLDAIAGFGDLLPELPLVTGLLHGTRNLAAYGRGEISGEEVVVRTAGRMATSAVGAALGSAIIPIPGVGAALGAWFAHKLVNSALEPHSPTRRASDDARQRRRRFEQAMQPLLDQLARDLDAWRRTVVVAAQVGEWEAWQAVAGLSRGRRISVWSIPSMGDFVRAAARARFEQEARVLAEMARAFREVVDVPALLELWQGRVYRLGGLAACDARIARTLREAHELAREWRQTPVVPHPDRRGPRPPLRVRGRAPWVVPKKAGPLVMATGFLVCATTALAFVPADRGVTAMPGRTAAVRVAQPAQITTEPPAPARRVEVVVDRCRVRAEPTTKSPIVGREALGSPCTVESQPGRWARVVCPSSRGFMHQACFRDRPPEP